MQEDEPSGEDPNVDELEGSNISELRIKKLQLSSSSNKEKIKEIMKYMYNPDSYHMAIASLAALRSKDPRTAIGACIVDTRNNVVGIGYNAMPYTPFEDNDQVFPWSKKEQNTQGDKSKDKTSFVCHAAVNAIASRIIPDLTGCTMYTTQHPDEDCANLIVQSGIKEVKYMRNDKRGHRDFEENADRIFTLGRVSNIEFNPGTEIKCCITRTDVIRSSRQNAYCASKVDVLLKKPPTNVVKLPSWTNGLQNGERIKIYMKNANPEFQKIEGTIFQKSEFAIPERELAGVRSMPFSLKLSDRMNKGSREAKEPAPPHLVLTWDEFFMGLAELQFVYSNDSDSNPKCKVGTCIVNPFKQVIAIAGSSRKNKEELGHVLPTRNSLPDADFYAHHAEYKAIASYKGMETLRGCTLYVTKLPCNVCAKLIAQSGIVEVVYKDDKPDAHQNTELMFLKCFIILRKFEDIKLKIVELKPPNECLLESLNTICFSCTKRYAYSDRDGFHWKIDTLKDQYQGDLKDKKFFLHSVNIFSASTKVSKVIKVYTSMKGKELGTIISIEAHGHFHRKYPETEVKEDEVLCRVTDKTIMDNLTIYFDIQISNEPSSNDEYI